MVRKGPNSEGYWVVVRRGPNSEGFVGRSNAIGFNPLKTDVFGVFFLILCLLSPDSKSGSTDPNKSGYIRIKIIAVKRRYPLSK